VISRVADSCFWLTRYLERVDTYSRLLDVTSGFSLDVDHAASGRWKPLIIVIGQEEDFLERFGEDEAEDGEVVQRYLVWDEENPFSIMSSMRAVRENARMIREVITVEMWEAINEFWLWLRSRAAKRLYDREREAFYQHICSQCMMFHGTCYSTMLHDDSYTFIALGRAVGRAGLSARLLDIRHHALGERSPGDRTAVDAALWITILRSCAAYEPFVKRKENVLSGSAVAEFMIFDRSFPRSVLHNLDRVSDFLRSLHAGNEPGYYSPSGEVLHRLRGSLLQMSIEDVRSKGLHETLTWIVEQVAVLCDAIHEEFLDPTNESVRSRLRRQAGTSWFQQQDSAAGRQQQAQTPSSEG
jgi:uncharacterized alpha-E superfamily protein